MDNLRHVLIPWADIQDRPELEFCTAELDSKIYYMLGYYPEVQALRWPSQCSVIEHVQERGENAILEQKC